MDRYGEAIEADLHAHYTLDLLDFFRGRYSWAKLNRLVARLVDVPGSHYQLAVMDDEEAAARLLDSGKEPSGLPPLSVWTPEVQYLAANFDRLGELLKAFIATIPKAQVPKIQPVPRPRTAYERVSARRSHDNALALVAEMNEARARAGISPD